MSTDPTHPSKSSLFRSIATEMADPGQIQELVQKEIQSQRNAEANQAGPFVAPRTPMEEKIVEIWKEFLGLERVGIHDDFFALGGHSLLATQVLSRVNKAFNVELPVSVIFTGQFTIAELARAIAHHRLMQADQAKLAAKLSKLSSLTDDEVEALLARKRRQVQLSDMHLG